MRLIATLIAGLLLVSLNARADACLGPQALQQLTRAEYDYLAARKVPTMQHAVEDGRLQLAVSAVAGPGCMAELDATIAQSDIDEVARNFEANPAKRIMLMSQGYTLPESTHIKARFSVDPATLAVAHADTLHNSELGKARATLELLYATQAQLRAAVAADARNATPWSDGLTARQTAACSKNMQADDLPAACACRNAQLSEKIGERQMDVIEYLHSDPYSYATGALAGFETLAEQVNAACKLRKAR